MKKSRLFFGLMIGVMMLVACNKPEGDTVPVINANFNFMINDTTVLKLESLSSNITVLDLVELTFKKVEESEKDGDSIVVKNTNVVVGCFLDTLWKLEPETKYAYRLKLADFVSDTIFDWDTLTTIRARKPEVIADTAFFNANADTLFLHAKASSLWRAVMDAKGIQTDVHLFWGTPDDMSASLEIDNLKVVIDTAEIIKFNFVGAIPVSELEGMETIWFKAYAKQVWGDGEKYSEPKVVSLTK